MNDTNEKPTTKKRVVLLKGDAQRRQMIDDHPEAVLISEGLPLRANLSVIENITVVLQYRTNTYIGEANDTAWKLLTLVSHTACAEQRDPDLTHEERFVAKLLRAIVLAPPMILIDRPAQMLPDTNYPFFLNKLLLALEGRFEQCWILDYAWNAPLYHSRA
jgi:ABC-type transporter Mla maintaining outer membrane lipid asymmetry ATPase subunit MlaF